MQAAYAEPEASFRPDNGMCCFRGPKARAAAALARLRESPLAGMYQGAQLEEGPSGCQRRGYATPLPRRCFSGLDLFTDEDPTHRELLASSEMAELTKRMEEGRGDVVRALDEVKKMCVDSAVSAEHFVQGKRRVANMFALVPDNGMACLQGTMGHLAEALTRIKASPLRRLFANATAPRMGGCAASGYTQGGGGLAAGGGLLTSTCFPKLALFWDGNETRHGLLRSAEASELLRDGEAAERRRLVQAMCGGRAEAIFEPLPASLA